MIEVASAANRILGSSPEIQSLQKLVQQAALTDSPVLMYGERGSGREFLAETLHQGSYRRDEPFEKMNCVGWSEPFLEAELLRRLDRAEGGTLFLDDVNELAPEILVRALSGPVRIVAACGPAAIIRDNVNEFAIRISIPPLRERKLDVPILVDHFIGRYATEFERPVRGIQPAALKKLMGYHWPGNIRELKNAVERAVILAAGDMLEVPDFSFLAIEDDEGSLQFKVPGATIQEIEKEAILRTMEHVGGSTAVAARMLNMSIRKIQYKLKEYRKAKDRSL